MCLNLLALYRFPINSANLAPVPPDSSKSFGQQLAAALNNTEPRVSQRELARRLAEADGTKWSSKRRWIGKLLINDVELPEPESVAAIEDALGLPRGTFAVSRPTTVARRTHLEMLEAEIAELKRVLEAARKAHKALLRRVQALEQAVTAAPRTQPATPARRQAKRGK